MSPFEQKQKSAKKLILTSQIPLVAQSNTTNITTDTTTDINSTRMAASNGITNKEALKDKIHDIHNYLRNHGAGYGMNALKVFNILYGLKKIEDKGLHEGVGLTEESRFSNLLNLANKNKDEEIATLIFEGVLTSIFRSKIKDLLFYEIPKNIRGSVFSHLIKEINLVAQIEVSCNVLLSGKIYEYFIGRDESAISELGAYFTDRHIVDYIYDKLNPEMCENGTIHSMIDMFGGSGGFTTGYIDNLNLKYPELVKWETEINKIYHYDMNEDVIKSAGLEFFCLTGVLPNMSNLKYKNSFTDEFIDEATNKTKKYHYVITNPPYGGDKSKKSEAQKKNEKIKEYIKKNLPSIVDEDVKRQRYLQLKNMDAKEKLEKNESDKSKVSIYMCSGRIKKFAKDNSLTGNDKEACSLMLMMDLLEFGGTSIGVLKEGVFFNGSYRNLRRCLIENYNVREVISVPQDQFENTSTKTSIIIFDNTEEKTTEIRFSELSVKKYEEDVYDDINGNIYLTENKGDIKGLSETIVSVASVGELLKHKTYSLNGKDYSNNTIVAGEGYELQKLSSMCEFLPKSKRTASFVSPTGKFKFYTSSENVQMCDIADNSFEEEVMIIGDGGVANIKMDKEFSCSDHNYLLKSDNCKYIFHLLNGDMSYLKNGFTGSVLKNISKSYLLNLEIPVPKTKEKIQEWVNKISKPYNEKNEKQARIKELETDIKNRIQEITKNEECDEVKFNDVCITKKGKPLSKENFITGTYPVIGGGVSPTGYHNDYNMEKHTILCSSSGKNAGFISKYNSKVWASDCFSISSKDINISNSYMYHLLKDKQNDIFELQKGSAQPHIYSNDLVDNIKFRIPKNKQLITDMSFMFQDVEKLQIEIKIADEQYKQYIQELGNESKQSNIIVNNGKTNVVIIEQVEEPIVKIRKIKKKSTV
jgi:type I restriction-modification system DNA methylase subunit